MNVSLPVSTIRSGYAELGRQVTTALRTQRGDAARLEQHCSDCTRLLEILTMHSAAFNPEELTVIHGSVQQMIEYLQEASRLSLDPPEAPFHSLTSTVSTGQPGRPRIEIDSNILTLGLELRGPTHLAQVFNCSSRTIRRRALELGIVTPGEPVYVDYEHEDGTIHRIYRSSAGASSTLNDDSLDEIMSYILEAFPSFGRRMIDGHLKHLGHHIPRSRIQASYQRVCGVPRNRFGPRRIQRRVYSVAGPNALWHHDGQHGLIRYKIVIHAFIDGHSRFVTGIRASNNNLARTVLNLFLEAIEVHGCPSRTRGDHGTENVLVAEAMERLRGVERGSYIWGRSVHNIRIERLWRDLTMGFGEKWKDFLRALELHDGLDVNSDAHIWLLHYLFLADINDDALDWANAWNEHVVSIHGERQRSPKDMFVFGMIENGVRGWNPSDDNSPPFDVSEYGIDWNDYDNEGLRDHHDAHNATDGDPMNPFQPHLPHHLSHIEVPEPSIPFSPEQFDIFLHHITPLRNSCHRNMFSRQWLWVSALDLCNHIFSTL